MRISPTVISLSLAGTLVAGTASAMLFAFNTFAFARDLEEHELDAEARMIATEVRIAKGQYYDRLDDLDETEAEGADTTDLEAELDDLLSFICTHEPTWPRCD